MRDLKQLEAAIERHLEELEMITDGVREIAKRRGISHAQVMREALERRLRAALALEREGFGR